MGKSAGFRTAFETIGASCGCGRTVPHDSVMQAIDEARRLECSTCGAVALPGRVLLVVLDGHPEHGCAWCGCPDFHDGEVCHVERQHAAKIERAYVNGAFAS